MKFFEVESMKALLWKVAVSAFLLSLFIEPIVRVADGLHGVEPYQYSGYRLVAELAGLVLAIGWGLCFRRANRELLFAQEAKRESCTRGIVFLLLFAGVTLLFPELLAYYNRLLSYIGGLSQNIALQMLVERLYATATRFIVLFSLAAVFFCRSAIKRPKISVSWGTRKGGE